MQLGTIAPQKYFNGIASTDEKTYFTQKLTENFEVVGTKAFGQMKFIVSESPDIYDWTVLDNFVAFAKKHKLKAHYNTVINNKHSFPDWFLKLSGNQKINALEKHIRNVLERYGNDFEVFKLVNEVVRDDEENFFETGMNKGEVVAKIFIWAKETCPKAKLLINDFAILVRKDVRKTYIEMIKRVMDLGGPIDIVGIQAHLGHPSPYNTPVFQLPSDEMINNALDEIYDALKLPIYITEFDLSYDNGVTGSSIDPYEIFVDINGMKYSNWFEYKSHAYTHFKNICESKQFVECLIYWSFLERDKFESERQGGGVF